MCDALAVAVLAACFLGALCFICYMLFQPVLETSGYRLTDKQWADIRGALERMDREVRSYVAYLTERGLMGDYIEWLGKNKM